MKSEVTAYQTVVYNAEDLNGRLWEGKIRRLRRVINQKPK